ncbi:hypothetical protein WJX77_005009 [Trebouxia sp. C0004]
MRAEVSVAKGNLSILEFLLQLKHALDAVPSAKGEDDNLVHNIIQQQFGQNDCCTCDASIVRSARADIPVFCLQVVQCTNFAAAPSGDAKSRPSQMDGLSYIRNVKVWSDQRASCKVCPRKELNASGCLHHFAAAGLLLHLQ